MSANYQELGISKEQAAKIALELYGLEGRVDSLPGELDFNFQMNYGSESYLLKISRPGADLSFLEFQQALLQHVAHSKSGIKAPVPLPDLQGNYISETSDKAGNIRKVRLLTWVQGRLWSGVNPVSESLLLSLGKEAGRLTKTLQGFEHPLARRIF